MQTLKAVSATITILIDNTIMEFIPDTDLIKRISRPGQNFITEHGFSALIETDGHRILVDTGATGVALMHNLKVLGLTMQDIDLVFLSHGHNDHTGGLDQVEGKIVAHPDSFHTRYLTPNPETSYDLTSPKLNLDQHQFHSSRDPVELAPGVMSTGQIKRTHEWEELHVFTIKREGDIINDRIMDDQGVIINTPRGLVVLAGCSHAGIINTIEQAIEITGISNIYAVVGGFHMIGPGEAKIEQTIKELRRFNINKLVPIHCTGFEATKRMSTEFPDQFEYCTTGCRLEF